MRRLLPVSHEEIANCDFYYVPEIEMVESLNVASIRELNGYDIPPEHITQACIESRQDVLLEHIRFLIDTDIAGWTEDLEAPNETYVLPRELPEPVIVKKVAAKPAPALDEERDPFLKDPDDPDSNGGGRAGQRPRGQKRGSSPGPGGKSPFRPRFTRSTSKK